MRVSAPQTTDPSPSQTLQREPQVRPCARTSFDPGGGQDGGQAVEGDEVGGAADVGAHQRGRAPAVRPARLLQGANTAV